MHFYNVMWLYNLCFLQDFRSSNYAYISGVPSAVLGYIPSGSRCGNVPNELVMQTGDCFNKAYLFSHFLGRVAHNSLTRVAHVNLTLISSPCQFLL